MTTPEYRWWIWDHPTPRGPYSTAFLQIQLKQGVLVPSSLICPDGGPEWRPVVHWPEFAGAFPPVGVPPPPIPPAVSMPTNSTPRLLGWEAQAVLDAVDVYVFYLSPALFLVGSVNCIAFPPTFHPQSPYFGIEFLSSCGYFLADIVLTGLLITAGLQLRKKQRAGASLLCWTLGGNALLGVAAIIFDALLIGAAAADPQLNHFYPREAAPAAALLGLAHLLALIAAAVFQLTILAWMATNLAALPLED